jgi:flagellar hook-associated protein 3 FlgL
MIQIESTQAHIGARMNIIDTLTMENESLDIFNDLTQSAIRDTDQFEAASRLMLQQTKLEAAQAAFVRVSQLSLFDRL